MTLAIFERVHRLRGEVDPSRAVGEANSELRKIIAADADGLPALDLVFLGMGEDGHIASLFPGHTWAAADALAAHVADSPKPPRDRITLTRGLLATATTAILLAVGEGKRAALERLVSGDTSLPAHGLPGLIVVTDLNLSTAERSS